MLRSLDGSPYQVVGSMQQFDPENPDQNLLHLWDQEMIQQGGAPIFYYEAFIPTNTIDPIYRESRGKIYSNVPVELWCYYDPQQGENLQNQFGIDSPTEMVFEFNIRHVLSKLGHLPKVNSRLYTPHKRENWKIIQRNTADYKLWGEMRLQLIAERFQDDIITNAGGVKQQEPDFKLH